MRCASCQRTRLTGGSSLTLAAACVVAANGVFLGSRAAALDADPSVLTAENASGQMRSLSTRGVFDLDNPFFQDLGTNGRRCVTCHQPAEGWTITSEGVRVRFELTDGADPIFRAPCPLRASSRSMRTVFSWSAG